MKIKGTPTSKRNPCPVCGKDHGCKIQEDKWVLCLRGMGLTDAPPNYRFVRPLDNGMGGLFVKDDFSSDWSEEQRLLWRQEQELKRLNRDRVQAQRRAKLLSIEERSRQYRLVNQDLTLIFRQRKVLLARGLTDAEIDLAVELGAIRTWNPGQRILGVSPDLAGVDPFTCYLAGVDGIAIKALNPDGNITGAQLKPDNQELGKYIWLTSANKGGNGPHLPNGELPLFVWKHPDKRIITEVWLCEGALKSLITALKVWSSGRTDIAVIGTANAARYGEKTLKDYLECLGAKSVCLMPDSGSAVNPHITQANRETIHQLKKWNYSVSIGDWGQLFEKNQLDIDELLVAGRWGEVQTISPEEFLQLHQPGGSYRGFLHPDTISEVRLRADIVDIVGQHVSLTQRGKDFVGVCLFHGGKTSSFSVSPTKQTYHCCDCSESGDVIKFLMEVRKCSLTAVVLDLARRYQVQARSTDGTPISALLLREHQRDERDATALADYTAWEAEQERADFVAAAFEKERRKREWQVRLNRELNPSADTFTWGQSYQEAPSPQSLWSLGYTPDLTVHSRYLSLEGIDGRRAGEAGEAGEAGGERVSGFPGTRSQAPPIFHGVAPPAPPAPPALRADASFLCIVSAMNTGKTQALAQLVSDPNQSVLLITNTIALAEALAIRYNCRCYNEDDINLGEVNRLVITADSLWKIPTFNKRFKYMIIDEADQVTPHLTNGFTCKRNREKILAVFNYFAVTAEHYILADADLSGTVIDWHSQIRGKAPFILHNTWKPNSGRIVYQFSDQSAAFEYGCQLIEQGMRVLFCCDSKTTVKKSGALLSGIQTIEGIENLPETLGEKLATRFPDKKGRVVHGDNSSKPDVRNFIKNINDSLKYIPLDYLVYNSSMQSGISIDFEAFEQVICLFTAFTLTHTELGQLMHRYRPDVPISFWINSDGKKGLETNCYKIAGDFIYKNQADGLSLRIDPNTGMVGIDNPEFLQLVASLQARRNWSLMNMEAAFKAHLEGMGYEIIPHPDEHLLTGLDKVKEDLKERKRIVDAAEVATICKSFDLTEEQRSSLQNKPNPDFNERCAMQKFDLHEFYGMEVTEELIEKDDGGIRRGKLTRLDLLLNPESMARRMDLSDRRKHHVITDLKHYKLQRDLLSDLGLLEFIDPEKEYHSLDLIPLGERTRLKAFDIKRILGITISVAPRKLRESRILAHKGIKALFKPVTTFGIKLLKAVLTAGTAPSFTDKQFSSQEQADEYCSALSPMAKLICEAIAIEKRFLALETSDSQIHAILCDSVGLKRVLTRQTKAGRFYRITPSSWEFAESVILHRHQKRDMWAINREGELAQEAKRFQHLTTDQMQVLVEAEIGDDRQLDAPALVFLAECWVKFSAERGDNRQLDAPALVLLVDWWVKFVSNPNTGDNQILDADALTLLENWKVKLESSLSDNQQSDADAGGSLTLIYLVDLIFQMDWWVKLDPNPDDCSPQSHPPRLYSIYDFLGGGVTKSQPVTPGLEVRLSQNATPHCPIPQLPNQPLTVEQLATGRDKFNSLHDYLKIKTLDGDSYWVPAEWLESPDGLPVRRDPNAYTPRIPESTIRTWRYWLLGVRTPAELEQFSRRRKPKDLAAVVDSLALEQLETLQQRFREWGISRDWLPSVTENTASPSQPSPSTNPPDKKQVASRKSQVASQIKERNFSCGSQAHFKKKNYVSARSARHNNSLTHAHDFRRGNTCDLRLATCDLLADAPRENPDKTGQPLNQTDPRCGTEHVDGGCPVLSRFIVTPANPGEAAQQSAWGVGLLLPGSVVECLDRVGRWTVRYCTGVVALIADWYGLEEYVSCARLRLVQSSDAGR